MSEPCALVEGPMWADTKFYGKWLLAAAKADALWKKSISDPSFQEQVDRLMITYIPDFNIGATVLLSRLEQNLASFVVSLNGEEEPEEFAMMIGMGFFVLTGHRYQMVIPARLTLGSVKKAVLRLAQTEDEECFLHPEYIVTTMPFAEANAWQRRLRRMDEAHRQADRQVLLDIYPNSPSVWSLETPHEYK
jgi:hypothetical protein